MLFISSRPRMPAIPRFPQPFTCILSYFFHILNLQSNFFSLFPITTTGTQNHSVPHSRCRQEPDRSRELSSDISLLTSALYLYLILHFPYFGGPLQISVLFSFIFGSFLRELIIPLLFVSYLTFINQHCKNTKTSRHGKENSNFYSK